MALYPSSATQKRRSHHCINHIFLFKSVAISSLRMHNFVNSTWHSAKDKVGIIYYGLIDLGGSLLDFLALKFYLFNYVGLRLSSCFDGFFDVVKVVSRFANIYIYPMYEYGCGGAVYL